MQTFYARKNGDEMQLLSVHLKNVSDLSAAFSNYENISRLVGILHDFGKATAEFQNYLEKGGQRGTIIHSFQGAFFADEAVQISDIIDNEL